MIKENTQPLRGMRDILPHDALMMQRIMGVAQEIAVSYGYHLMDTPVLERTELFARSIGENTDVVGKEMYSFLDKNQEYIALRPEMTAGIVRATQSHYWQQRLPVRLLYQGAMFRHERPQKGRYRQFHQIGIEALGFGRGYHAAYGDLEVISIGFQILQALGLMSGIELQINSLGSPSCRQRYRDGFLAWLRPKAGGLSPDSQKRLVHNPLRILDSKKEQDQEILREAPNFVDYLDEESHQRYRRVQRGLRALGIDFVENHRLVRGLDYYGYTIFEFVEKDGARHGTVMAGGCYDGLSQLLGGSDMTGVGWALGVERLANMLTKNNTIPLQPLDKIGLLPLGEKPANWCMVEAQNWRREGLSMVTIWQEKLKKGLKIAAKQDLSYVLIVGENEMQKGQVCVRDMKTGKQEQIDKGNITNYFHAKKEV